MIEAPKLLNHENDAFIESKNIPRWSSLVFFVLNLKEDEIIDMYSIVQIWGYCLSEFLSST